MKLGIVVQARMGSTRLPGKTMADIDGRPLLRWMLDRVGTAADFKNTRRVVAIPAASDNALIAACARGAGWEVVYGTEADVIGRYWRAVETFNLDGIVFMGADQPLMDPVTVHQVLIELERGEAAYVRTTGQPWGLQCWGISREAIRDAMLYSDPEEREHVGAFWDHHPSLYPCRVLPTHPDLSETYRLTVDEPADLELHRKIIDAAVGLWPHVSTAWVVGLLEKHPEWYEEVAKIPPAWRWSGYDAAVGR